MEPEVPARAPPDATQWGFVLGVKLILAAPVSPRAEMQAECPETTALVMSSVAHHLPLMTRLFDGATGRGSETLPGEGTASDLNLGNGSEVRVVRWLRL